MSAVGLFIYQSLDAIDGKQARRTNSSSALGELFDHGCDAVSTGASLLIAQQNQNFYSLFFYISIHFIWSPLFFYHQSLLLWEHASHAE